MNSLNPPDNELQRDHHPDYRRGKVCVSILTPWNRTFILEEQSPTENILPFCFQILGENYTQGFSEG